MAELVCGDVEGLVVGFFAAEKGKIIWGGRVRGGLVRCVCNESESGSRVESMLGLRLELMCFVVIRCRHLVF